ncbi:TPA: DUF4224 domain-containing protein [Stenotrophomonas maltophilia]|nr:DUF4224 domain-containing protein [Stenotrophomonas maltophilia]MBH1648674.1 DUF4224 domain-containing protein [Stenotrophomonas maltophilia]MBH1754139.1 DUF4224 domain-containing protein [Stenotrophomonas maltophilia]MBH1811748.1 DUF4224 domain-containing protein [Stenotrophomonas maltophilia]MBH1889610.1 DUF4224 domain-containing protein [Stenotrophomonas maltophilia]
MSVAEKIMRPGAHGDVAELTGAHTKRRQIQNLARNGIPHTINAAGWPVVMWSAVDGSAKKAPEADGAWSSNAMRPAA